jgi:hypothetical protein
MFLLFSVLYNIKRYSNEQPYTKISILIFTFLVYSFWIGTYLQSDKEALYWNKILVYSDKIRSCTSAASGVVLRASSQGFRFDFNDNFNVNDFAEALFS